MMMKAQIRELHFEDTHDYWFYNNLAVLIISILPFKPLSLSGIFSLNMCHSFKNFLRTPQRGTSASLSSSPNDIINMAIST